MARPRAVAAAPHAIAQPSVLAASMVDLAIAELDAPILPGEAASTNVTVTYCYEARDVTLPGTARVDLIASGGRDAWIEAAIAPATLEFALAPASALAWTCAPSGVANLTVAASATMGPPAASDRATETPSFGRVTASAGATQGIAPNRTEREFLVVVQAPPLPDVGSASSEGLRNDAPGAALPAVGLAAAVAAAVARRRETPKG